MPGRVRTDANAEPLVVAGMPSNTVDLSAFQTFLARAAVDERFTADRFLAEIDHLGLEIDLINRLALQTVGVGIVRERLLTIVDRFDDFVAHEPTFGPGRFDTFNPAKALLNWDFADLPERERIGVVDFPSVFLQGPKQGMQLHWDGNNTKVSERNRSAAFGTGATPPILDRESLKRMEDWLETAEPPRFADAFPGQFDPALAAAGRRRSTRANAPPATARAGATSPASASGKVDADRRDRHRPRRGSTTTPTSSRSTRTRSTPAAAPSASRPSARPTATPTRRSTASGCARPTCTTARCRRSRRCSCRPRSARARSCAATTSTTRGRWVS